APAGVIVNAPAAGTEGPVTITATAPGALPGQHETFTLVVQVDASTPDGTVIANTASVSSQTIDPVASNNAASAMTTVTTPSPTPTPTPTPTPSPTPTPTPTTTPTPTPTGTPSPSPVTLTSLQGAKVKLGTGKKAKKATVIVLHFNGALDP